MKPDRWTKRCPYGHTSMRSNPNMPYYYCQSCGAYFDGEPHDARRVDGFPIEAADSYRIGTEPPANFSTNDRHGR